MIHKKGKINYKTTSNVKFNSLYISTSHTLILLAVFIRLAINTEKRPLGNHGKTFTQV